MTNEEKITAEVYKQLNDLKRPDVELTEETVPTQVLNTSPDQGAVNAKAILKLNLQWYLIFNGYWKKTDKRRFHTGWLDLPIKQLVQKLLILLLMLTSVSAFSQLEVNLGANRTEAKNAAISIGLTYARTFDSIWSSQDYFFAGKNSLFTLAPELDIQTGNEDAFSSLQFKLSGIFMRFKTEAVPGGDMSVDASRTMHVFPISVGVETSNYFENINTVIEAGYVPWYQSNSHSAPAILKHTTLGFWLQSGYKFKVADSVSFRQGGKVDESLEDPNSFIFRVKGNFGIDTKTLVAINGLDVGLVGKVTGWADVANGAFYHAVDLRSRFYLTDRSWIDFVWQKGSMAPLFNSGTQTGIAATIKF